MVFKRKVQTKLFLAICNVKHCYLMSFFYCLQMDRTRGSKVSEACHILFSFQSESDLESQTLPHKSIRYSNLSNKRNERFDG